MNMYLHGIGGEDSPVAVGHPFIADIGERFHMLMINPNFGKKSSITVCGGDGNGKADKEAIIHAHRISGQLHPTNNSISWACLNNFENNRKSCCSRSR